MQVVALLATGGTIASTSEGSAGYAPSVTAQQLAAFVPTEERFALEPWELMSKAGYALGPADVLTILGAVATAVDRDDVVGVIVTCGTAAMEELPLLIDLAVDTDKPIIVTGAMLHATRAGYDGGRNLADAVEVIKDGGGQRRGAMILLGGELHDPVRVRKVHKTSMQPLVTWPDGPVGIVDPHGVSWWHAPRARVILGLPDELPRVDMISDGICSDGRLVDFAATNGARGIVVEGMPGGGGVSTGVMEAVGRVLADGVPVVVTSRSPFGRSLHIAGGGSGPRDLLAAGAIACHQLSAAKARAILMMALARTSDVGQIATWFGEIDP